MGGAFGEKAQKRQNEEGRGDHGNVAGNCSGNAADFVADADTIQSHWAWSTAAGGDGDVELPFGEEVAVKHQVLMNDGKGAETTKRSETGFQQQKVEQDDAHWSSGSRHRAPMSAA